MNQLNSFVFKNLRRIKEFLKNFKKWAKLKSEIVLVGMTFLKTFPCENKFKE